MLRYTIFTFCVVAILANFAFAADDEDYYEVLGFTGEDRDDTSDTEIKKSFRTLSKKFHPDLDPSEGARERFQKIQRAYDVLSDRKKRKIYDIGGDDGLKQLEESNRNPHHQQGGMMDPFAQMFGFGGQQQQQGGVQKGQDAKLNLQVPLKDIYNGASHRLSISKQKLCKKCKGSGAASKQDMQKCHHCNGAGQVTQRVQLMPGFVQQVQQQCPHCNGKGKTIKKKCPKCKGSKVTRGDQPLDIQIEQGIPDGHQIVMEMEADQNPDQIPGDVIFVVQTQPDPDFTREGDNLESKMKIPLKDALLGFNRRIVHMDGHGVEVDRTGITTQYGHRTVISGEGMPKHNVPSEKGTLGVTFEVSLPRKLTPKQREVLTSVLKYQAPEFDDEEEAEKDEE